MQPITSMIIEKEKEGLSFFQEDINRLICSEDYEGALSLCKLALLKYPNSLQLLEKKLDLYIMLGRNKELIQKEAMNLLKIDEENLTALNTLVEINKEDVPKLELILKYGHTVNSKVFTAMYVNFLIANDEKDKVVDISLEIFSGHFKGSILSEIVNYIGNSPYKDELLERYSEEFSKSHNTVVGILLCKCYYRNRDFEKSYIYAEEIKNYLRKNGGFTEMVYYIYAKSAEFLGMLFEAKELLEEALEYYDKNSELIRLYLHTLYRLEDTTEIIKRWKEFKTIIDLSILPDYLSNYITSVLSQCRLERNKTEFMV